MARMWLIKWSEFFLFLSVIAVIASFTIIMYGDFPWWLMPTVSLPMIFALVSGILNSRGRTLAVSFGRVPMGAIFSIESDHVLFQKTSETTARRVEQLEGRWIPKKDGTNPTLFVMAEKDTVMFLSF